MAVSIYKRKFILRLTISWIVATGALLGVAYLLSGPRLGPYYDFLMRYRRAAPVSQELAIIETGTGGQGGSSVPFEYSGNVIEPATVSSVLVTLTELDARSLIIQVPVLGVSSGNSQSETELQDRFNEEFALLGQNIRNLFQAIRVGSIPPGESEQYVGDLVGLTERGKDRLLAAFMNKDEAGTRLLDRASAAFGQVWQTGDLQVSIIQGDDEPAAASHSRWYSRPRLDSDGVFRRISPILFNDDKTEHIAFTALKDRYDRAEIDDTHPMPRLHLVRGADERFIPLDAHGRMLVERPIPAAGGRGADFKRLSLTTFMDYEKADQELFRLLSEAETQGYFAYIEPETWPTFLYKYTRTLRDELLDKPGDAKKSLWREFRGQYIRSLEGLIYGSSETDLVAGYEKLIASERLEVSGLNRMVTMRDEVVAAFAQIREKYEEFKTIRSSLSSVLERSLCILGPVSAPPLSRPLFPPRKPNPTSAEAAAILANSLLTGHAVIPLADRYTIFWSLIIALLILFCLKKSSPGFTLIIGLILTGFELAVFSFGFIFTDYWIDPLIPAASTGLGVLASCLCAAHIKHRIAKGFRRAYSLNMSPAYLRQVIRVGRPLPEETLKVKAAIIAIRQPWVLTLENRDTPLESAAATQSFRRECVRFFTRAGGTFIGADGDLILIAFGSPLERICLNSMKSEIPYEDELWARSNHSPAAKAVGSLLDFAAHTPETASWCFGIDTGECAFTYAEPTGYSAFGAPLVRARILSSLANRYKAQILVTGAVIEKTEGLLSRKLDVLKDRDGAMKEPFYELLPTPKG